jgi:hypothetical protein
MKLKHWILLLGLLLIGVCICLYTARPAAADCFDGFYSGVGLGTSLHPLKTVGTRNVTFDNISMGPLIESLETRRNACPIFSGFIGYAKHFDKFYSALEGTLEYARKRDKIIKDTKMQWEPIYIKHYSKINYQLRDVEPSLDLKFGYRTHDRSVLYYRVGAAYNKIKGHVYVNSIAHHDGMGEHFDVTAVENFSMKAPSFRNGVGILYKFDRFNLQADYVLSHYGTKRIKKTSKHTNPNFVTKVEHGSDLKLMHQAFKLSIIF